MADCNEFLDMISESLDGELNETDEAALRAHIDTCPDCKRVYDAFKCIGEALGSDLEEPPEMLSKGVMFKISTMEHGSKRHFAFGRFTAIAACLAVIVFAGSQFGWFGGNKAATTADNSLSAPTEEIAEASAPEKQDVPEVGIDNTYDGGDMLMTSEADNGGGSVQSFGSASPTEAPTLTTGGTDGVDLAKILSAPLEELDRPVPEDLTEVTVYEGGDYTAKPFVKLTDAKSLEALSESFALRLQLELDKVPEDEPSYTVVYKTDDKTMLCRVYQEGSYLYCLLIPESVFKSESENTANTDSVISGNSTLKPAVTNNAANSTVRSGIVGEENAYEHVFYLAYIRYADFCDWLSTVAAENK